MQRTREQLQRNPAIPASPGENLRQQQPADWRAQRLDGCAVHAVAAPTDLKSARLGLEAFSREERREELQRRPVMPIPFAGCEQGLDDFDQRLPVVRRQVVRAEFLDDADCVAGIRVCIAGIVATDTP